MSHFLECKLSRTTKASSLVDHLVAIAVLKKRSVQLNLNTSLSGKNNLVFKQTTNDSLHLTPEKLRWPDVKLKAQITDICCFGVDLRKYIAWKLTPTTKHMKRTYTKTSNWADDPAAKKTHKQELTTRSSAEIYAKKSSIHMCTAKCTSSNSRTHEIQTFFPQVELLSIYSLAAVYVPILPKQT